MERCNVRRGAHWMAAALAIAIGACGGDDPVDPGGAGGGGGGGGGGPTVTASVNVDDNVFNPEANQVSPGATVTWTWIGGNQHNVTFASGAIASSVTQTSGTFATAMPTVAGVYSYVCTIHQAQGMTGAVTVQ